MKKILFTIALLTILTAGCSKKENSSKNGNVVKQFDTDEAFANRKSYNLIKGVIDNSIPYAQMICINPHYDVGITDVNAVKSKILKVINEQYSVGNDGNEIPPVIYNLIYIKFDDTGFIEKINEFNWADYPNGMEPWSYSSSEYTLTNFGIETVHRKNGELYDKFTILFEEKDDGINMNVHNELTARITKNTFEDAAHKTTYEPGEDIYRFDDHNEPGNYCIYENGILTKQQEGKYLYYIEGNKVTKINLETGEKDTNSEEIKSVQVPFGFPVYQRIIKKEDRNTYIERSITVLNDYDKVFDICSMVMPEYINKSSE